MATKKQPLTKAVTDDQGRRPEIQAGRVAPTQEVGSAGFAVYGGNLVSIEKDARLNGTDKYRTFGEILANLTIAGAGVRFFLNLVSAAKWRVEPAEDGGAEAEKIADRVQDMLESMDTSWYRIVRKAAMYRFYGFAVLEWVARRDDDGTIVFADVENRPQVTITRWDTDEAGKVLAALQTSPQTQREVAIPREKMVYLVDDSLSDSPEGMGLFRHIVKAAARLERYEQLEGFGYEGDMRGIPLMRAPLTELKKMVAAGVLKKEDMTAMLQPLKDLIENHVRNPNLGMLLDSEPYRNKDAAQSPSNIPQWDLSLLEGGDYSLEEIARAIERVTMEIARVLGVEHLLLGSTTSGTGSYALSRDKSNNFGLIVDSTLKELREQFKKDLLEPLFKLNGWDAVLMPKLVTDTNVTRDIEQLSAVIRDLSTAGVVLDREDEAVAELFNLLGLPRLVGQIMTDPNAQLADPNGEQPPAPDGSKPAAGDGNQQDQGPKGAGEDTPTRDSRSSDQPQE